MATVGAVSGIVGLCGFTIQSVQVLSTTIGNIQQAKANFRSVRRDLEALEKIVGNVQSSAGAQPYDPTIPGPALADALDICRDECQQFQQRLEHWTRHSSQDALANQDRLRLAIFKTGPIASFSKRLGEAKATLQLAILASAREERLAAQGMTAELREQFATLTAELQETRSDLLSRLRDTDRERQDLESSPDFDAVAYDNREDEVEDVRRESALLRRSQACIAKIEVTTGTITQEIRNNNFTERSTAFVGVHGDVFTGRTVNQRIHDNSASGDSRVMIGAAGNQFDMAAFFKRPG